MKGKKGKMAVTGIVILILAVCGGLPSLFCEMQGPHSDIFLPAYSHEWAVPIEKPGLPNLHQVSEDLYRGAQPTAEGFRQLKALGVKTVINLRFFHSDRELITGTDLEYEEISMNTWHTEDEDVVRFLTLVSDKSRAPFFVHCQHGADRTGMMCAVYRIVIQGWTRDEAIKEMTSGGFGFHEIWPNLVAYLQAFDLEKLKQHAF